MDRIDEIVPGRDPTDELRLAHDGLAEIYAARLAHLLEEMPIERSVLALFAEHARAAGGTVGDIGCGTGRLAPYLAAAGLAVRGVDLSPEMVRVARRDHPGHDFAVGDLRALPFADGALAGVVCWYSLIFLPLQERAGAYAELARVVRPGGCLAAAYKVGDGTRRRAGGTLGPREYDVYWLPPQEVHDRLEEAGFRVIFWGGRPAEPDEKQPQGYVVALRG